MIRFLRGRIAGTFDGGVVVDVNSIGYEVFVPETSLFYAEVGKEAELFTAMIVREDDVSLYGFPTSAELRMFWLFLTVNGIGAKAALSLLSALSLTEIISALQKDDAVPFTKASGVGKKTAQRIVIDLKDKIDGIPEFAPYAFGGKTETKQVQTPSNPVIEKAIGALTGLGLSKQEAEEAAKKVYEEGISTEDLILKALRLSR